jgi:hypothetical protein
MRRAWGRYDIATSGCATEDKVELAGGMDGMGDAVLVEHRMPKDGTRGGGQWGGRCRRQASRACPAATWASLC